MRVTWLLLEELAVGSAPCTVSDLDQLQGEGVRAVLSLCAVEEAELPIELADRFHWARLPLPDHHHDRPPSVEDLGRVIVALRLLRQHGPVYLHCVAGVERSPLAAMAWLIKTHRLGWQSALDYVQQTHAGTSPLPEQLAVLRRFEVMASTPDGILQTCDIVCEGFKAKGIESLELRSRPPNQSSIGMAIVPFTT